MTSVVPTELRCPKCGTGDVVQLYRSANVTLNPELKQRVLRLELTRWTCPKCGVVSILSGLVYHDMSQRRMTLIGQAGTHFMPVPPSYSLRQVATDIALAEKVKISDDGFDDRAIEITKYWLCQRLVTQYAGIIARFTGGALNAAALLYAGNDIRIGEAPPDAPPQLLFLYLLLAQPFHALSIAVPRETYDTAVRVVVAAPDRAESAGVWHSVDFNWAQRQASASAESPSLPISLFIDPFGNLENGIIIR